jgi:hypothetical protein
MPLQTKDDWNEQFARTSESGVRDYTQVDNQGTAPLADESGRLWVRQYGSPSGGGLPSDAVLFNRPEETSQQALIYGEPTTQGRIEFYHWHAGPLWLQFFDVDDTLGESGTDVPDFQFQVPENRSVFSWDFPYVFTVGYLIAISVRERVWDPPPSSVNFSAIGYHFPPPPTP